MALPYATEDQLKRVKKELEDKIGTGGGEIPEIPTKLSELTNDTGFITEAALADYALKTEIPEVGDLATKTEVGALIKTVGEGLQVGDSEHTTNINTTEDNKVMINSVGEVVYSTPYPGEPTRKVVQFKNNDQLSGVTTGGAGVPLIFVSKWDKVEVGGSGAPLNLNGSTERPTYKDDKELAFVSDLERIISPISKSFNFISLAVSLYSLRLFLTSKFQSLQA